jgi:transcriptional regulator with XRE-family HTH domain
LLLIVAQNKVNKHNFFERLSPVQRTPIFLYAWGQEGGVAVRKNEVELGGTIRQLRKKAGLTQEELADMAGIYYTYLGEVERGNKSPTFSTLIKIADALGVRVADLVSGDVKTIVLDERDVLRKELLSLMKGKSPKTLRKVVKVVRTMLED